MTALEVAKSAVANRTVQRGILQAKKYSPTILTAAGVVGIVTAGILASRASMNVEELLQRHRDDIAVLKDSQSWFVRDDVTMETAPLVEKKDYQKELTRIHFNTGKALVKKYGPAVTLGVVSIGALIGSHGIMRSRVNGLAIAYKGLETAFGEYRGRVVEEFGEEKDRDYRHGIFRENTTDENGKKKKTARIGTMEHSEYARFFDDTNRNWEPTPAYSMMFLKAQQTWANQLLWRRGHVTLNDVYDALGFDRTPGGQLVGWVYTKDAPSEDNYIDFGLWDLDNAEGRMFVNGDEKVVLLDFNVHGIIYDQI